MIQKCFTGIKSFTPANASFFLFQNTKKSFSALLHSLPPPYPTAFPYKQSTEAQGSDAYAGAVSQDTVKITIRLLHIFFMVTSEHLFLTDKFQHSHYSTIFLVADIQ
ncbi:hypothetical protein AC065_01350 [Escherichia coli]|nr:hypothetical protein AC065_01350 [Escherichia coli]